MTTTIDLTEAEIEELKIRTKKADAESALKEVAHQFLRTDRFAGLKAMAGTIEFEDTYLETMDDVELADKAQTLKLEDESN